MHRGKPLEKRMLRIAELTKLPIPFYAPCHSCMVGLRALAILLLLIRGYTLPYTLRDSASFLASLTKYILNIYHPLMVSYDCSFLEQRVTLFLLLFIILDVNECRDGSPCHKDAECINTRGSFACECMKGFERDGLNNCKSITLFDII